MTNIRSILSYEFAYTKVMNMKIVAICGSMKYEKQMQRIAFELETKHSFNVLQCIYGLNKDGLTPQELSSLKQAQFERIDISDAIYVVDIDNYIGDSTKVEISYAKQNGKEIIFHSDYNL